MDPYVYPGTTVLKNKFDQHDQDKLNTIEANIVWSKFIEIYASGINEKYPLDAKLHRGIHKYLFGDVYPFAGKFRTITIAKEGEIVYPPPEFLNDNADKVWRDINKRFSGPIKTVEELLEPLAESMGDIHVLHPFREGNTRTLQIASREIAWRAGYALEWMKADPSKIRLAGTAAAFGDNGPYIEILTQIAKPVGELKRKPIKLPGGR